ncbi:MAG: 6-carboxytetrahydropterin synthase, partial [Gammaproteobacteria bacterium]
MPDHLLHVAAAGFESACRIDVLPEGHRSRRLHGHSFLAKVRARLPQGWASFPGGEVDDLRARLSEAIAPLDYALLNEQVAHPTDENLARWIRARLEASGSSGSGAGVPGLEQVGIQSTLHSGVDLDARDHAHVWRRYVFEAAHQLTGVPAGHKCGRMHGHGFEVILHADQDLG